MLENVPKMQAQGAPERHRKMLQNSIKNRDSKKGGPREGNKAAPPIGERSAGQKVASPRDLDPPGSALKSKKD